MKAYIDDLVQVMTEGLVIQDAEGHILRCNRAALGLLELSEAEVLSRTAFDPRWRTIREDGTPLPGEEHASMKALRTGQDIVGQIMGLQFPDRPTRWIRVNAHPLAPRPEPQVLVTFSDITDQKDREHLLVETQSLARIGSWRLNLATRELIWSSQQYEIFEMTEPQPADRLYALACKRIHPEDLSLWETHVARATQSGEGFVFDHRLISGDGARIKHVHVMGRVSRDANGRPLFLLGSCQDLTERVHREGELRDLVSFSEAVRSSARVAIITADLDGLVTTFNDEAERILGYTAAEVVGQVSPVSFHDPAELAEVAAQLSREHGEVVPANFGTLVFKARQGRYDERQWTYLGKGGVKVQVRLSVTALHDAQGNITGFVGIARDLTEDLRLQQALEIEKAKSLHAAKLASLGEMSAGIAHEINNPLTVIMGNLALLGRCRADEKTFQNRIEALERAGARIEKIVKGLRKFSRFSADQVYRRESVAEIVSDALTLAEARAKRDSTAVEVRVVEGLMLYCDGVEIGQVVVNLINNAVDAVKDQADRWVRLEAFDEDGQVVFRVTDSGAGISAAVEEKLFEPFFTTKPVGQGTGLGLSISKAILDQHRASIRLNRESPHTCFEIRFPRAERVRDAV